MQFATGDPAVAVTVMGGEIWTGCLNPPKLGGSSGAAELAMPPVAVKEAMAHCTQATEMRQGSCPALFGRPRSPSQDRRGSGVPRDKYVAAKLVIMLEAEGPGKDQGRVDQRELPPA